MVQSSHNTLIHQSLLTPLVTISSLISPNEASLIRNPGATLSNIQDHLRRCQQMAVHQSHGNVIGCQVRDLVILATNGTPKDCQSHLRPLLTHSRVQYLLQIVVHINMCCLGRLTCTNAHQLRTPYSDMAR